MTRTLIYAMQSSGASAYAFQLGRNLSARGRVLCIPDLWHPYLAICPDGAPVDFVVLKVVVTNRYTLDQHIAAFKPTETILFRRERNNNIRSLASKSYANESGDMEFKFSQFDSELSRNRFPVADYEYMPWQHITTEDLANMRNRNAAATTWAEPNFGKQWGFGGIRTT